MSGKAGIVCEDKYRCRVDLVPSINDDNIYLLSLLREVKGGQFFSNTNESK